MNMKTNIKTAFLFCLALFSACSSDNDEPGAEQPTQQPTQEKRYPLTIDVTENPLIVDGDNGGTRAAITTTSTLEKFNMSYVYYDGENYCYSGKDPGENTTYEAEKDKAGKWISDDGNWPNSAGNKTDVTWYAYTDGDFKYDKLEDTDPAVPYIDFTQDEAAMYQKDLLVAKKVDNWNNCNGHLFFAFDHACSALRFSVKKSTNLNGYTLNITNIQLCNVVKDGKYDLENGTWKLLTNEPSNITSYTLFKTDGDANKAITLASDDYIVLNGTATTGDTNPYLFLIPQPLSTWSDENETAVISSEICYLQITCTITDNKNQVFPYTAYYYPFATTTLEKGHQYDVNINIGKKHLYKIDGSTITKIFN